MFTAVSLPQTQPLVVYTKLLTDIPILPKHRLICMRMAVIKNMEAANYGVAGRLLQVLTKQNLPDQANLETRLRKCEEERFADSSLPAPYSCPTCGSSVSVGAASCNSCSRPTYYCFQVRCLRGLFQGGLLTTTASS